MAYREDMEVASAAVATAAATAVATVVASAVALAAMPAAMVVDTAAALVVMGLAWAVTEPA